MKRYQLIIFDLDGTILDTLDDLMISTNAALTACGFPARSREEIRRFVGNGISNLMHRAVPEGTPEPEIAQVHTAFTAHYREHCADHTRPYPGIPELIEALRQDGRQIAVVSNKADYAVQELCAQYFPGLIDLAAGEREGVRRKPEPDPVYDVLGRLDLPKDQAVYIGDSEVDIETAQNAGLDSVIVEWGFRDKAFLAGLGAEIFAADPEELRSLLL